MIQAHPFGFHAHLNFYRTAWAISSGSDSSLTSGGIKSFDTDMHFVVVPTLRGGIPPRSVGATSRNPSWETNAAWLFPKRRETWTAEFVGIAACRNMAELV